jgi:hypothetical protein
VGLDSLSENAGHYPQKKNETFSEERHLKIQLLNRGLKRVKFSTGLYSLSSSLLCEKHSNNRLMISRLELVRITTFSGIDPSFTTGKLIGV